MRMQLLKSFVVAVFAGGILGCGSKPPPKPPEPEPEPVVERPGLQMHGEFGVLDEDEVRATFERVWKGPMTACQREGGDPISGHTVARMRIDHQGSVKWAYFKETNLGDRTVEKCMLDALRQATWPIPQGGDDGLAEQELPFADYATRPPVEWSPDKVRDAVDAHASALSSCRGGISGTFVATAIVKTNGSVASVGIQPPDETAEDAADCMVEKILEMKFPKTGSWHAKVSFDVP